MERGGPKWQIATVPGINFDVILKQGGMFWAHIPSLDRDVLDLKLEGFDQGGIWIQSQKLTDKLLSKINQSFSPTTAVIFVPYTAIHYAFVIVEGTSLSAEKLGL